MTVSTRRSRRVISSAELDRIQDVLEGKMGRHAVVQNLDLLNRHNVALALLLAQNARLADGERFSDYDTQYAWLVCRDSQTYPARDLYVALPEKEHKLFALQPRYRLYFPEAIVELVERLRSDGFPGLGQYLIDADVAANSPAKPHVCMPAEPTDLQDRMALVTVPAAFVTDAERFFAKVVAGPDPAARLRVLRYMAGQTLKVLEDNS